MFKKTRIRLVVLNSLVFFLLLNGFAATLYLYTQHRLYDQVDHTLIEGAQHVQREGAKELTHRDAQEREAERRIVYLLWDAKDNVQTQVPPGALLDEDYLMLRPLTNSDQPQTVTIGGQAYRVFSVPVHFTLPGPVQPSTATTQRLQVLYNLAPEQSMLHSLLLVGGVADLVSAIVAVLAGLYLASKALVPIQQAWNRQQEFVEDASHEMRTPLAVMKLQLERLFRHPESTIEQESANISDVIQETRRMSKLVTQLLTLARSDSNQLELQLQKVRIDDIVRHIAEQFEPLAVMKEIRMETSLDAPLEMTGDEERLSQLFVILIDNALKYTPEGGTISVTCSHTAHLAHFVVSDTGVGIPKEDLPHIFGRFFRGDKARTRTQEGTGLGLSIAKWIVEAHKGKLWADSEPGVGTRLHVTLPLRGRG
jgi:two-component system, OmpR family, sensor histidine kinase CiaH